jgi:hypothetical protein
MFKPYMNALWKVKSPKSQVFFGSRSQVKNTGRSYSSRRAKSVSRGNDPQFVYDNRKSGLNNKRNSAQVEIFKTPHSNEN